MSSKSKFDFLSPLGLDIIFFERESLPEGVARPSAPQQAVARGKTILSDHSANQGMERSAGATPSHGVGGAAASTVTGKLIKFGIFVKHL